MNKQAIRDAMRGITAGVGRRKGGGGGGNSAARLAALIEKLRSGGRATKAGKIVSFNAPVTARMAAQVIALGGTVPAEVAARYSYAGAAPAIRALAVAMDVDPEALLAALCPAQPEVEEEQPEEQQPEEQQPVASVAPIRQQGGRRR